MTVNMTIPETPTRLAQVSPSRLPLVVDLDGTLVRSDLLVETAFAAVVRTPWAAFGLMKAFLRGKAALKQCAAASAEFDPSSLPYDEAVLEEILTARLDFRFVYLASAANERVVKAVAEHLRLFEGYIASDGETNCSGKTKADLLVEAFGEGGFDYIGNDAADLPVWARSANAIAIRPSGAVSRKLATQRAGARHLPASRSGLRTWLRLLRVHQYVKNMLVFVPLLAAHQLDAGSVASAVLATVSFCLCASSVYILNDFVDIQADRAHPIKKKRPLAAGDIPPAHALLTIPALLLFAGSVAAFVSTEFLGILLGYFALTTAYSFYLKRKMVIDVVTLAMLYTARIVAGAVAIGVEISQWLLAFSLFIFVALALVKRYAELASRLDLELSEPSNRNYRFSDLGIVAAFAAASGYNAVTVLALYVSSPEVHALYQRPQMLWLVCPVLIYWISRVVLMAHRRSMQDDPIVFAMRDRNSLLSFVIVGMVVVAAV
jgi:4-hydroxybenzoate polyprenyltransferase